MKKIVIRIVTLILIVTAFWFAGFQNDADKTKKEEPKEQEEVIVEEPKTGFVKENDGTYYYNEDGTLRLGWQTIEGERYYFKKTGKLKGKMFVGKLPIQEKTYYFDGDGKLQTGWIEYQQGCWYYALDDGSLISGLQYIDEDNRYYWFAEDYELWGNLKTMSEGEVNLVREALKSWDAQVTPERQAVIVRGMSLIGKVTYTQKERNTPSSEEPQFLDCSSYVANCFYYGAGCLDVEPRFCTDHFLYQDQFVTVPKEELIPGDIFLTHAEGHWQTGNHIGIYIGKLSTGEQIFMHCAGDVTEQNNPPNRGIWITIRDEDQIFRRYHGFM